MEKYCLRKCTMCEEKLDKCPKCGGNLAYELSYDINDLLMFCKSCKFIGVVKDQPYIIENIIPDYYDK